MVEVDEGRLGMEVVARPDAGENYEIDEVLQRMSSHLYALQRFILCKECGVVMWNEDWLCGLVTAGQREEYWNGD